MKKICAFAIAALLGVFSDVYGDAYIYLDGKCISYNGQCGWCDPNGAPPPGNCVKGYAGCMVYAYIANSGADFTDKSGNRVEQYKSVPYGEKFSTWYCGSNGWTESKRVDLIDGCNEYTYFDEMLGKCVNCPSSGVFNDSLGIEMPVRGDYYDQKLSGCHYYGIPGHTYHDETGTMVFEVAGECHNEGTAGPVAPITPVPAGN